MTVICNLVNWKQFLAIAAATAAVAAAAVNWNLSIHMLFFIIRRVFIIILTVIYNQVVCSWFIVTVTAVAAAATADAVMRNESICMCILY